MKRQAEEGPAELKEQVDKIVEGAEDKQEEVKETPTIPPTTAPVETVEQDPKKHHQHLGKKIRIAILAGYNGVNFWGSQKNDGVRSVEGELEKALHAIGMISSFNFGDLKKIGWGRATRTDKKVHALINTFSAKVLVNNKPTTVEKPAEDGNEP